MSLNCRLSNHNNTSNNLMKRQSSTSSHSYDDLSDQFDSPGNNSSNRLACSRNNGYAKILPRSKAAMSGGGGVAQDMWAVKAGGQAANSGDLLNSGSLVLPRYFFQPGAAAPPGLGFVCNTVGGGRHSFGGPIFGGETISERHHGTARSAAAGSSKSAPSGKKRNSNKYHKIGPRTLNPPPGRMGIPPYALVPVRICDRGGRGEEGEGEGENETIAAPWERGASGGFAVNKPVPSHHHQLTGGHGLASPAQVLSLQTSAIGLHAASGPKASTTPLDGGGSGGNDIFMSLRRLTKTDRSAVRHSGASSCSGGSSSTTTTATAAELSRLHQAAPLGGGGRTVVDSGGGDVLEDDAFSNDDYVDMTSDAGDDDEGEESLDENYKALTDRALDHLVG
jgi:hypothetical protein